MPKTPRQLKQLYDDGANISAQLRRELGVENNTPAIIELAYDLQSGSYIAALEDAEHAKRKAAYAAEIANVLMQLGPSSILEAGVGEATTLSGVLNHLGHVKSFGFDISWSRVAYARQWLSRQGITEATLCTGDLLHIPLASNSIDVVYTSHSIEPNRGHEARILQELYRVARTALVLLEPAYELATQEARQRMDSHGYCTNLPGVAESLGYRVVEHRLFPHSSNPLNPTALTVISKTPLAIPPHVLACPRYGTPLQAVGNVLFSPEALVAYPILAGIPCLRIENGILASKLLDLANS